MHQTTRPPAGLRADRSRQLHEVARELLPGGTSRAAHQGQPHPTYALQGSGCWVTDVDGNRYLDFYNNATSLIHGHAHPGVVAAIEAQARRGTAFALPVEGQIALAGLLRDRIGSVEQVRFVNSGSEAVLLAIQAARALTGRECIAKFEGLYHGSAEAVEVSLDPGPATWGSERAPASVAYTAGTPRGVLESVIVLPFNDPDASEAALRANASRLAAVIVDVMPMRLGFTAARADWLRGLRSLARELGILLISDEVVTFRLDHGGAQARLGYDADLTVLGKVIGGGLPVGAVAGPRDVMRAFDDSHGRAKVPNAGTFNANPLTLAAGLAAMSALTADEIGRINGLGDRLRADADAAFAASGVAAHATGSGSLFALHMTDRRFSDYRGYWHAHVGDAATRARQRMLYDGLRERGILLTSGGVGAISTAMSAREVDDFGVALGDTLDRMRRDGAWASEASG